MKTVSKLLIVDDEPAVGQVLEEVFTAPDYHFTFASSGDQALEYLRQGAFDLMLLDKNLPGLAGMEVMRRARDMQPDIGVVMITAFPSYDSLLDCLRLGALDYLEKPFAELQE